MALMGSAMNLCAQQAPKGQWRTLTLTDGSKVRAELRGNAFMHYWMDEEGNRYTKQSGSELYADADMKVLRTQSNRYHKAGTALSQGKFPRKAPRRIPIGGEHEPLKGTHKELIILVNFSDCKFQSGHDAALFNAMANEKNYVNMSLGLNGSVRDYFEAQSDGDFTMDFDVVGPVLLNHPYAYYGENDQYGTDAYLGLMTYDAVKALGKSVEWNNYDNDGDGYVDQVFILYAGANESAGGDENTVWPHKYSLSASESAGYQPVKIGQTYIDDYACSSELTWYGYDDAGAVIFGIAGIGTLCHEFSHCLGLPDVYDTGVNGNYGMNTWSIMDAGEWNGINAPGLTPPCYTAYERMYCGWRQPIELTEDTQVRGMKPISEGGNTYIIYNKANRNEYYLLENRQMTSWDEALEGRGLIVTHVDFDKTIWENNEVNNTDEYTFTGNTHQRLHVLAADNSYQTYKIDTELGIEYYDYYDVDGDAYPYGKLDSLSNMSMPRATLYNANSDGRKLLNVGILNIKQNDDLTIDFDFRATAGDNGGTPADEVYLKETFDQCNGKGGNDGLWSGSIATSQLLTDVAGWTATNSKNGAYQCAKFGSSRVASVVTSPEFAINGTVLVSFKAAAWAGDPTDLNLSVYCKTDDPANFTLKQTQFEMKDSEWTTFTTTLTGFGKMQLRFTPQLRFFLDEVEVRGTGDITGIDDVRSNMEDVRCGAYDLTGRKLKNIKAQEHKNLHPGLYIINGHKVLIK